ncbi:MAG: hypothetical protein AAF621_05525 [Pseudomonadota bacterium]
MTQQGYISARHSTSRKRTNEILSFMKAISVFVDPEETIDQLRLNIDNMEEEQLVFMITRTAIRQAPVKEVYEAVQSLETIDLIMLNLDVKNFEYFIITLGAFFYARSVMRLVSKKEIIEVKDVLGEAIYKHTVAFGRGDCKDDYPIRSPFKKKFHIAGQRVFELYFSDLPHIIQDISMMRSDYEPPEEKMEYLKIDKSYATQIVRLVQSYLLKLE